MTITTLSYVKLKINKMKKVFFITLGILFSLLSHAQFKATKDGVKTTDGKDFYVVEIEGKTAKELYDNVESYIIANFKNPDAVSNNQEGRMINLHGNFTEAFPCKKGLGKIVNYADVELNIIIYFKDNKIRFDAPIIHSMVCKNLKTNSGHNWTYHFYEKGTIGQLTGEFSMFKKNGEVKNEFAVNGFNEFINKKVNEIIDYAKGNSNNDW